MNTDEADEIRKIFFGIKADEGMTLTRLRYGMINGLPAREEQWVLDGVKGASTIFTSADVRELTDAQIFDMLHTSCSIDGPFTISRGDMFVLVNHSFSY